MTPLATALPTPPALDRLPRLYREGERPRVDMVPIAQVKASGNAYATRGDLEARLLAEGTAAGADYVVVTQEEVIEDRFVVQGRSGLIGAALTAAKGTGGINVVARPVLHGVACRRATATLGAVLAPDGQVQYVRSDSPAEKAGLEEGMRLLAVNENFVQADEFVLAREISCRKPGESVQLDVATINSGKVRIAVVLGEPPQDATLTADESSAIPSPLPKPPSGSYKAPAPAHY